MSASATATGRVANIFWSNEDLLIGMLDGGTKFKGFMPRVHLGDMIALHGTWFEHPRHGKQIDVRWFTFPYENECDAEQLAIADSCKFLFEELELEKRGEKIFRSYRGLSRSMVTQNPYLVAKDVPEVGFKTAEKIADKLGIDQYDDRRIDAKIEDIMQKATYDGGHTFLPLSKVIQIAGQELELDYEYVQEAIERLAGETTNVFGDQVKGNLVIELDETGKRLVYPRYLHVAEKKLAETVGRLLGTEPTAVSFHNDASTITHRGNTITLSDDQRLAVETSLNESISIITGGPGVGKTTIVKAIVDACVQANLNVDLCSFTGRAARRLGEAAGRASFTIHRLLAYDPRTNNFQFNENNMLGSDVLICDETSMVNAYIGSCLFQAIKPGTRVILVGDVDQLPPIGPGALFRDLIASRRIPTVRLETIFRQAQSSLIITGSRSILKREEPEFGRDPESQDLFKFSYNSPESGVKKVVSLVTEKIPEKFKIDAMDIQVLVPTYKGPLGIDNLNKELQIAIQGRAPEYGQFIVGDKVIFSDRNDYDLGVMNGDLGRVTRIEQFRKKKGQTIAITVEIDGVEYTLDEQQQKNLFLAYAISIHKSQGSEYPATVVLATAGMRPGFYNRNMLYTAVTRGKKLSIVVTPNGDAALKTIIETDEKKRNSRLIARMSVKESVFS